ncbi:MAG: alpha/beta hydrolase family protein [Thiomonas sp.]
MLNLTVLSSCGGGGGGGGSPGLASQSGSNNTLLSTQIDTTASMTRAALQTQWLSQYPPDQQALIGSPVCGVQVNKFTYATVGGQGEPTGASGALMLPTGSSPQCQGPRPVVLYAHGTAIDRAEDMSAVNDPNNPAYGTATRVALTFAAQGYIVIAPNYAGYDVSTLPYAPYLNGQQQSQDMVDGLTAGRQMLTLLNTGDSDNGQLFVTGYSQGGYVSMATLAKLDAEGRPATAGAPMSGPYAILAMGDEIFLGHPNYGGTAYLPLIANAYAHLKTGSISLSQVFSSNYPNAGTLFPGNVDYGGFSSLVTSGQIPTTAIFQSTPTGNAYLDGLNLPEGAPLGPLGFSPTNYLISTAFRAAYVRDAETNPDGAAPPDGSAPNFNSPPPALPANPQFLLRQDLKANDLRNYTPSMPLLMCGGHNDPEVFWNQGAAAMTAVLDSKTTTDPSLRFATLDLDTTDLTTPYFASFGLSPAQLSTMQSVATQVQTAFTAYQSAVDQTNATVGLEAYHTDETPYCTVAARAFFNLYAN